MVSNATPARREGLLRAARKVIECNREVFSKAGKRLGEIYSEEYLKQHDHDGKWDGESSDELVFPRLDCARLGVIHDDYPLGYTDMRFEDPMPQAERKLAASMVVLALVLAIDPRANEHISKTMCPFAALPWEYGEDVPGILGREMICWRPTDQNTVDSPPGNVLDLLEQATWSARTGDVMPAGMMSPTGDGQQPKSANHDADFRSISSFPTETHGRIRQAALPTRKTKRVRKRNLSGQQVEYSYADALEWWPRDFRDDDSAPR